MNARGGHLLLLAGACWATVAGCGRISEDGEGSGGAAASDASTGAQPSSGGAASEAGGSPNAEGGSGGTGLLIVPDEEPLTGWDWWIEYQLKDGPNEDDNRPERPADSSLGLELGEAGWRDSTTPLCTGMAGVSRVDLWADAAGVAVLLEAPECGAPEGYDCDVQGDEVWYNQGSGWTWLTGFSNKDPVWKNFFDLAGLPAGDLLLASGVGVLAVGRDGTLEDTESADPATGLVDDGDGRAYSAFLHPVLDTPTTFEIGVFDGDDWASVTDTIYEGFTRLSVIDGAVYLVADEMYRVTDGEPEALPELPDADAVPVDLTGTSADDLYAVADGPAGTELLRLVDTEWTPVAALDGAFVGSWANGDSAYLVTENTFGSISESGFEPLATLSAGKFAAIHGLSGTEIFLAVLDADLSAYACDTPFLFHWDGAELHPF